MLYNHSYLSDTHGFCPTVHLIRSVPLPPVSLLLVNPEGNNVYTEVNVAKMAHTEVHIAKRVLRRPNLSSQYRAVVPRKRPCMALYLDTPPRLVRGRLRIPIRKG